jgi:hypothetical protein
MDVPTFRCNEEFFLHSRIWKLNQTLVRSSNYACTEATKVFPSVAGAAVSILEVLNVGILIKASFSSQNKGEKHYIRISVAFRLYLVKIIQILTN